MARGEVGTTYAVTSGDPKGISLRERTPTLTTTKMLQPEMSDMPMSAMTREMTTNRRSRRQANGKTNVTEDIDHIKDDHSPSRRAMKVVRAVIPHLALMCVFFVYLGFGAWVFSELENESCMDDQKEIDEAKRMIVELAGNRSCLPEGSTPVPPQDALSRDSSQKTPHGAGDSGMRFQDSEDCDDTDIINQMDEQIDKMMQKMVRSGMTVGKMDSMLINRTWNLTSAMLFSMTTITTIGYGDIAPKTVGGRVFCIFYSIIGIPLALLCLANIGNLLARLTLTICRATHRCIAIRRRICTSCGRSSRKHHESSSQRKIVNSDVEIPMEDVGQLPVFHSKATEANQNEPKTLGGYASDNTFVRSVSIATDRPTSQPHGITKQPSAEGACAIQGASSCGCPPHQCQCERKPDVLEEVPLLVVVAILVVYMCGGAAWMASAEGWDFGTGIYFMFITLTTIGFGDVLPMKHYADDTFLPCLFFTLFGLAIMSMCIALVQVKILRCYKVVKDRLGLC